MKRILILLVAFHASFHLSSQALPHLWDEVQTIKKFDQQYQTPPHPIVFVGSSSIRKWDDLQQAFGNYNVLNRGIGGAVISDIIFYLNDLVFVYQPKQIVIYVGENDLTNEKLTADSILNQTKRLYQLIRAKLPSTPIIYISFKPSPSRDRLQQKAIEANRSIQKFFAGEKSVVFVDIYSQMLRNGKSRPELFVEDQLHMNTAGYKIWEDAVKKYLMKK
ncbi:MAG: GDSL family lipase [Bacteroidetes bacterium]|nr:GDSL family lipase [Bacteroidota bacterium]MBI3482329.1 GDSL family lipase [Bacteroidota bacterium]